MVIAYQRRDTTLVVTKGHPIERGPFFEALDAIDRPFVAVEQPLLEQLASPESADRLACRYPSMLFYDMPGMDFSVQPPLPVAPSAAYQQLFMTLLKRGVGMVFLHHAIAAWPTWPQYGDIIGGRFLYWPQPLHGAPRSDSGYLHNATYRATAIGHHPLLEGVESDFEITDELYLYEVFDDVIDPILTSDADFSGQRFHSATKATMGDMYAAGDWSERRGSPLIGWVTSYLSSPIVYLQPGDGAAVFTNPNYRRLLANALQWVDSDKARAYAVARARGKKV